MTYFFDDEKFRTGAYIIAEIGINHNGDMNKAFSLIDDAKKSGADAVKFQTFKTEWLILKSQAKMPYQVKGAKESNQYDMLKKVELNREQHQELINYCREASIGFISTPYDGESAAMLKDLGVEILKVASTDTTNISFLRFLKSLNTRLIISTGVTEMDELKKAMDVFKENDFGRIALLHCVSNYPAPLNELNLRCISTLKQRFNCSVGFSDHTAELDTGAHAVYAGAEILEKHLTFDKEAPGPDHAASITCDELKEYVERVRQAEVILGDGIKRVMPSEEKIKLHMQKSIVAKKDLCIGRVVERSDLWTMRPATGISALHFDDVVGKRLTKDKGRFEQILDEDIEDA